MFYDFHGILTMSINAEKNFFNRLDTYDYFRTDYVDRPDIQVNIDRFEPNLSGCCELDEKYWIKKNYIYYTDN